MEIEGQYLHFKLAVLQASTMRDEIEKSHSLSIANKLLSFCDC